MSPDKSQAGISLKTLSQSPTDDAFVQDPYRFYQTAREQAGSLFFWEEYAMPCCVSFAGVWAILRDRRFGREAPEGLVPDKPAHQAGFWAIENHSMLELEPPRHTRLRGLVLRAFTSRRINALEPEIRALSHQLIDDIKGSEADLLTAYAQHLPVIIIARLLGVPENRAPDLLRWSHDMVGMYQGGRTHKMEVAAAAAASEFSGFLTEYIEYRRSRPEDDLITHLIAAEEDGEKLTSEELISTCVLLLNAGHEATVHSLGNGIKALLSLRPGDRALGETTIDQTVEECLRIDPPVHMFQRWAYEDIEIGPHTIARGTKVACLLGAANHDTSRWEYPAQFDPSRPAQTNVAFGAGVHFCIGAPLARLEMRTALPILFERLPNLRLTGTPRFTGTYHFHGLESLPVTF